MENLKKISVELKNGQKEELYIDPSDVNGVFPTEFKNYCWVYLKSGQSIHVNISPDDFVNALKNL
jgi:Holliday junction resolvase